MKPDQKLLEEIDKLSFEEALARLEQIVSGMENGSSPLEKMIDSFEEGSILASACQSKLDALRKKIEILRKDRQSGNYKWTPLNTPSTQSASAVPSAPSSAASAAPASEQRESPEENIPF